MRFSFPGLGFLHFLVLLLTLMVLFTFFHSLMHNPTNFQCSLSFCFLLYVFHCTLCTSIAIEQC